MASEILLDYPEHGKAQRFARHASPLTTIIYTHPGDEELRAQVRRMAL